MSSLELQESASLPCFLFNISFHSYSSYFPSDPKSLPQPFFWYKTRDQVVDNVSTISYQAVCQQPITNAPAFKNMIQCRIWREFVIARRNKTKKPNFPIYIYYNLLN